MPRFFFLRDKRMNPGTGRRKPRLERRNASKNFDYDAASFSSSTDETSSCSSSLRTRSLEISDRTSFRVEGNDGEIDRICRSLGLTGIEDFAIPADAWKARKIRSSTDLTRSRLNQLSSPKQDCEGAAAELKRDPPVESNKANEAVDVKQSRVRGTVARDSHGVRETAELALREPIDLAPLTASTPFFAAPREAVGIKGVRPPFLKPPPSMRIQVMDNEGSTWDIVRNFAPEGERESEGFAASLILTDDEEEKVEPPDIIKPTEVDEEEESESFTASNDDSSSSATEPTSISPNMRYKRTISNWIKGELLGRGSFGSVYEGIAELSLSMASFWDLPLMKTIANL